MLTKLLSLLIAGKGGALAAATIVAGATTVSVMTTSPELQDTLGQITSPGMSQLAKAGKIHDECEKGQPAVVAQRNAADKLLRDAYQDEHKRLNDLRAGKDVDHKAANEILRTAGRELRDVLTTALNDVARETLGREGHVRKADASASPSASPTASPTASPAPAESASPTPKPSCTPKPSASATPSASPTAAASPTGSPTAVPRGRAAVAARVTLNATLQAIVDKAKADMTKVVDDAEKAINELPAVERGKPADKGRPESERGKPEERKPADAGKPADRPGGRPSAAPGKP